MSHSCRFLLTRAALIAGLDLPPGSWTLHSLRADSDERLIAQPEPDQPQES